MKANRIIYYEDPLNDDFAGNHIKARHVGKNFRFIRGSRFWRLSAFLLYYLIALPLVFLISKVYLGVRIENRGVMKRAGKRGGFLYLNHTQYLDVFIPPLVAFPKKAYTVANADAVSLPGLGWLVQMLGALPVPNERCGMPGFIAALERRFQQGNIVAIYPEAHIWPFYTGIRPFRATSFRYPAKLDCAVFTAVTIYRKRSGLFRWVRRPGMTIRIEGPFYPNSKLPVKTAAEDLRDRVYRQMLEICGREGNVCYIHYVWHRKEEIDDDIDEGTLCAAGND